MTGPGFAHQVRFQPMHNPAIAAALDAGAVVVTPNNRLARAIATLHDRAQSAAGRTVWPTPQVLPWSAWLTSLWLEALAADAWPSPFALLNATQSSRLWERAVEADALELLDPAGAAERAASAWRTFHAHADPQESPAQFSGGGDDAAAFARWARRFARSVEDIGAADLAVLPGRLVEALARVRFVDGRRILLAGFVELTPLQSRLTDALRAAGATVDSVAVAPREVVRSRAQLRTPTDELVAALQWARARTLADPAAQAAIVILDLPARIDLVVQLADEVLRPQAVASAQPGVPRPYNISLAPPLAAHPLAVTALDLLELGRRKLPLARALALLRSPWLVGGSAAAALRARHEGDWRERNVTDVSPNVLIQALSADDPLREGVATMSQRLRNAAPRSPHDWADMLIDALRLCGWPGGDAQASDVYQAHDALLRAIGEWRSLALVDVRMDLNSALSSLRSHWGRTTFQPEGAPARIQILGMLEAAGLDFDGLWLAGMDADAWPPRVTPEAFLPAGWQRARGVVQASAERSLARAAALTVQLAASAREVVASHVTTADTPPRSVSPLCDWPLAALVAQPTTTMRAIATAPALQTTADARLPELPLGIEIKGGVRVVELQSDCPFRAAATLRLRAGAWPRPGIGLTAMERGNLVHAAMASLWSSLQDQATLLQLDDAALQARIAAAVKVARDGIAESRWRAMPAVIAGGEASRLATVIFTFLREHESLRPPFRVLWNERKFDLAIGGVKLALRIDRVDAIDNGIAVIDYKTGGLPSLNQWLLARPVAPQTGLYALALRQHDPAQRVRAVALASIRSGAFATLGIADDGAQWPGLATPVQASDGRLADFAELESWWVERFDMLADAFRRGDAAVTPRTAPNPCAQCDFKPFCRVDLQAVAGYGGGGESGDMSNSGGDGGSDDAGDGEGGQ